MEITSRNTNTLGPIAYQLLQERGILDQSRNGPVLRLTEPITIRLTHPAERVNFCPVRDANPFFHLFESAAMLADENNIPFLSYFAKQMAEYSDDGFTQNAFYGSRLRSHFRIDQLNAIIRNLGQNPHSRQEVALIWDSADLTKSTKDKACNLLLMFAVDHNNNVTMTSVNRSNDAIWGMVNGANVVHLSFIHEYVARSLGRPMASWFHFSNNFHVYVDNPKWEKIKNLAVADPYGSLMLGARIDSTPLFIGKGDKPHFDFELNHCVRCMVRCVDDGGTVPLMFEMPFVQDVAVLFNVHQAYKLKLATYPEVFAMLSEVRSHDWRTAVAQWLARRKHNFPEFKTHLPEGDGQGVLSQ